MFAGLLVGRNDFGHGDLAAAPLIDEVEATGNYVGHGVRESRHSESKSSSGRPSGKRLSSSTTTTPRASSCEEGSDVEV